MSDVLECIAANIDELTNTKVERTELQGRSLLVVDHNGRGTLNFDEELRFSIFESHLVADVVPPEPLQSGRRAEIDLNDPRSLDHLMALLAQLQLLSCPASNDQRQAVTVVFVTVPP